MMGGRPRRTVLRQPQIVSRVATAARMIQVTFQAIASLGRRAARSPSSLVRGALPIASSSDAARICGAVFSLFLFFLAALFVVPYRCAAARTPACPRRIVANTGTHSQIRP